MTFPIDEVDVSFPANNDQRNVFQWSNQVKFSGFQFATGLKLSSGLPYTEIVDIRNTPLDVMSLLPVPIYGEINAERLPLMKEVNFSAQYSFQPARRDWKGTINIGLTNVFDAQNVYDRNFYVRPVFPQGGGMQQPRFEISDPPVDKYNLSFTPNMSIRIEW